MKKIIIMFVFLVLTIANSYAQQIRDYNGKVITDSNGKPISYKDQSNDCVNCSGKMNGMPKVDVSLIQKVSAKQIEEDPKLFESLQGTITEQGCHFVMTTKKCTIRKNIGNFRCFKITYPDTQNKPQVVCK